MQYLPFRLASDITLAEDLLVIGTTARGHLAWLARTIALLTASASTSSALHMACPSGPVIPRPISSSAFYNNIMMFITTQREMLERVKLLVYSITTLKEV